MVRTVDYDSRRRAVLASTINRFIQKAAPVASEDISREFALSPATIRNIFMELEEAGYLTHPYTSGGRIPTSKGYRYYVDFLISQMEVLEDEKERIIGEYRNEIKRLDEVLERTSEIISTVTHYAGLVSFLEWQSKFFYRGISSILDQPEFQNLESTRSLIKMIEDKQKILDVINRDFPGNIRVYIGEELGYPGMDDCSLVVSTYRLKNKPSGRLAVLGPKRMEYRHAIPALEYITGVLTDLLEEI